VCDNPLPDIGKLLQDETMSEVERVAPLISECMDRCRNSGLALASLVGFLDELRESGHSEVDVQFVDNYMRRILGQMNPPHQGSVTGFEST